MKKTLLVVILLISLVPLFSGVDPFSLPVGTVIIDAGHGGRDPGATKRWAFSAQEILEKEINLDIAQRLATLLRLERPDLSVLLTRENDRYLSLDERSAFAYQQPLNGGGALFVSIHVNSAANSSARGFEVLTKRQDKQIVLLDAKTPKENIALFASHPPATLNRLLNNRNLIVASTFAQALGERLVTTANRGVKEQDLWVLNQCRMPAVLVEVGFLTNEAEARRLMSSEYRQLLANALCDAIIRSL